MKQQGNRWEFKLFFFTELYSHPFPLQKNREVTKEKNEFAWHWAFEYRTVTPLNDNIQLHQTVC